MSETNRSGSRTTKASPLGSQLTTLASSLRSISISFRGKGLECPVDPDPGLDVADNAGETDPARWDRLDRVVVDVFGLVPNADGLSPGCILMTPAAMPPDTGTSTAGGGPPGECECDDDDRSGEW